jgi:hypothetical protein
VRRSTSQPSAATPSQSAKSGWHARPHDVPSHVATEFGPLRHGVHRAPHVAGLITLAQAAPQTWKYASQVNPQCPAEHVAWPLATVGQVVEHDPQCSVDAERSTHWLPHSVGASPPQPVTHVNAPAALPVAGAQSGAFEPHLALQAPQ